jgi:hypothetical protein
LADLHESYADDIGEMESDVNPVVIAEKLQPCVDAVSSWAESKNLRLAADKSHITLFTPWTKEVNVHPQVTINGSVIPLKKSVKWLGVTVDSLWCMKYQSDDLCKRCTQRLPMMKAVRDSSWGFDKNTLLLTYNTFIKPVFSYAPVIWVPNTSKSNIARLQKIQNRALRYVTGCHQAASEDHLHQETGVLPVADRLDVLCTQYLASAMRRDHPSHETVLIPSGPRRMKETLQSRYMHAVEPYLYDKVIMEASYKRILSDIHMATVSAAISRPGPNRVLGCRPPAVSSSEKRLPRSWGTTLSHLRSDFCSKTKFYQFFIKKVNDDLCPECQTEAQSVNHLFRCPALPTSLRPIDLWKNPITVANFLRGFPSFAALPAPPVPPPPDPPP